MVLMKLNFKNKKFKNKIFINLNLINNQLLKSWQCFIKNIDKNMKIMDFLE